MRTLHIIPAAFDYFDDIRSAAFVLVGKLPSCGIEADAFTLQYGNVTKKEQGEVTLSAPTKKFVGFSTIAELVTAMSEYDLVHVHGPLLGAAGRIISWKKLHLNIPLVVTVHRRVKTPDFFSLGILWYNMYYMPKLSAAADFVDKINPTSPWTDDVALRYAILYNTLLEKK